MVTLLVRAVVLYLLVIAVIRLLGKRQLGQLEPSEVAVTMLVADLASFPMQEKNISILSGIVPILAVLAMELALSVLSMRSIKIRKLLCGKPVILIENGKFLQDNMRKNRVTIDELVSQLRQKDVLDPEKVQYAILETGGNLSVFLQPGDKPAAAKDAGICPKAEALPVTIISDGRILQDNLSKAGKDSRWLQKILSKEKATPRQTFLLTVDKDNQIRFFKKE